jgi:hypothetical protein
MRVVDTDSVLSAITDDGWLDEALRVYEELKEPAPVGEPEAPDETIDESNLELVDLLITG